MIVGIQDEILKIQSLGLLNKLLFDKTTKRNILWATDAYKNMGADFARDKEIKPPLITGLNSFVIKNRARKALEQQTERVKQHGEVFTPFWVCQKMIDCADENWFGAPEVFFAGGVPTAKITFTTKRTWKQYVDSRRLEIACGEAPFLVSRYDVLTGEVIPIENRTGILDRKMRAVNENAADENEWLRWALRAFQATYGYEFQGDNLLIARINLLMTFEEYLYKRWKRKPTEAEYRTITNIIAWNIWQMDGLTGKIPYCAAQNFLEMSLFDNWDSGFLQPQADMQPPCRIYDWRRGNSLEFLNVNKGGRNMKFDFIIGNPPYQDETIGDNSTYAPPIYNLFMDEVYKIANKVILIHPARFLFNAGSTPKAWNKKMLNDKHFKILAYEEDSKIFFNNTDIKGGIVISYRDNNEDFEAIEVFTKFYELSKILAKVKMRNDFTSFSTIMITSYAYHFEEQLYIEHPELKNCLSKGHEYDFKSNVFEKMPQIFYVTAPQNNKKYVRIVGRIGNERTYRYVQENYVNSVNNLHFYKVFLPGATGTGQFGESIAMPFIGLPKDGSTETYLSIGKYESLTEAENTIKYIRTKFTRAMLGILKSTQANTPGKWQWVPLQDFTSNSDIDWSKSVAEIDKQLYKKYGLDEQEIKFIETHVKEMA